MPSTIAPLRRTLGRWHRRVQNIVSPGGHILLYHQISTSADDPWSLCVSPENFEAHLECISGDFEPVSLREMRRRHKAGQSLAGLVAVTFDDGYADNLHIARELLHRFEIPATVFAISDTLFTDREFWWDRLYRLIVESGELLQFSKTNPLRDAISEGTRALISGSAVEPWKEMEILFSDEPDPRRPDRATFYFEVYELLRMLPIILRDNILLDLLAHTGLDTKPYQSHRPMTVGELKQWQAAGMDIGAHTVHHPALADLSPEQQQLEIVNSKQQLESALGCEIICFSYPHGSQDVVTREIVRHAGFELACCSNAMPVRLNSDPYSLPRKNVTDMNADTFACWIRQ